MMKTTLYFGAFVLAALLHNADAVCPHEVNGLSKWSDVYGTVKPDKEISITSKVLLDVDISLKGIHIKKSGILVVDPKVRNIKVYYVLVDGEFHIGSEDCPFSGQLLFTLMGKTTDKHKKEGLSCNKCISVKGTLELHGEFKRPWTKLAKPLNKISDSDILYSKLEDKKAQKEKNNVGLIVRIFDSKTGSLTNSGTFRFPISVSMKNRSVQQFSDLVNAKNNDCVVMAMRKAILKKGGDDTERLNDLYEVIEKLGYGKVTNNLCLRGHVFYDAFVMVVCKGDLSLTKHSCGDYRLGNRFQIVEECVIFDNKKFCGKSVSSSKNHGRSYAVFEVTKISGSIPKITLAQEPTNWVEGDEVCVTSTDYDWEQVECGKMMKCSDCKPNEIRVNLTPRYNHYAKVTKNVDMRAEVFVNTRNVRFTSDMEKFGAENGGMIKYDESLVKGNIENVELFRFGDSTEIGIYPIHYHMCHDVKGRTYAKNNAIHDSWSRCVVVHGTTGAIVDGNTCYFCTGHAFFTEDGGERDTEITNNLGVGTMKANQKIFTQLDKFPATFFISNPYVTFSGNIAAGGVANGIQVIFPDLPTGLSKDLEFMEKDEAKRTPMKIENCVTHSYSVGFKFTNRLTEKNENTMFNKYQPTDASGNPMPTEIRTLTAFKNRRFHADIEAGFILLNQSSFADGPAAVQFRRGFSESNGNLDLFMERAVTETAGQKPSLTNCIIIGDSDNKGTPVEGEDRSLPNEEDKTVPRCGIIATSGVWSIDNTWFGGFSSKDSYEAGAICTNAYERYAVSPRNTFKNVEFGFKDPSEGNRIKNIANKGSDTSKYTSSIFYDEEGKVTTHPNAYVLQTTEFHQSEKSESDAFWKMEISEEDFAQVRVVAKVDEVTMMRSDEVEETTPGSSSAAFNVITGEEYQYIVKFSEYSKGFTIGGVGITKDKTVVVGVCIPRDSSPNVRLNLKDNVKIEEATKVEDVFTGENNYFWDKDVGVVVFKLKHTEDFAADDIDECPKGICPRFIIHPNAQKKDDLDCFEAFKKTYLVAEKRRQLMKKREEHDHDLPASDFNKKWGAGPFPLRK